MLPNQNKHPDQTLKFFNNDLQTEFCYIDLEDDELDTQWIGEDMESLSYDNVVFENTSWS